MDNNDVLRRLRYILDLNDETMMNIFSLANWQASRSEVSDWLKKEIDPTFQPLGDKQLISFLDGLIVKNRGKKDGPQPEPEKRINNNLILKKLKIALNFKTDDVLEVFDLADRKISQSELSSFLRKFTQEQYCSLNDQYLRNFLIGLQIKFRQNNSDTAHE